jgi:lipoprotein-releasing system ATP-binding protein
MIVETKDLCKRFIGGDGHELTVLEGVEISVSSGEVVAVVGSSGAGKSTLLHLLGALDRQTSGEVLIDGCQTSKMDSEELAQVRNETVGFVFQFHHLLREFTVLENVMMPCLISGLDRKTADERAKELIATVGLEDRMNHHPAKLSGGEQQRVALARALSNHPLLLLADEPSGNLDSYMSHELHDLLFRLKEDRGLAVVLVTHNRQLAQRADRIMELRGGCLHAIDKN